MPRVELRPDHLADVAHVISLGRQALLAIHRGGGASHLEVDYDKGKVWVRVMEVVAWPDPRPSAGELPREVPRRPEPHPMAEVRRPVPPPDPEPPVSPAPGSPPVAGGGLGGLG